MTTALEGGEGQRQAPAAFTPEKDPVPTVQEAGLAPGHVWTGAEISSSTGTRSPDRPGRNQSLYRLSHPGPNQNYTYINTPPPASLTKSNHYLKLYWDIITVFSPRSIQNTNTLREQDGFFKC
jgi:hypothetical protein